MKKRKVRGGRGRGKRERPFHCHARHHWHILEMPLVNPCLSSDDNGLRHTPLVGQIGVNEPCNAHVHCLAVEFWCV